MLPWRRTRGPRRVRTASRSPVTAVGPVRHAQEFGDTAGVLPAAADDAAELHGQGEVLAGDRWSRYTTTAATRPRRSRAVCSPHPGHSAYAASDVTVRHKGASGDQPGERGDDSSCAAAPAGPRKRSSVGPGGQLAVAGLAEAGDVGDTAGNMTILDGGGRLCRWGAAEREGRRRWMP